MSVTNTQKEISWLYRRAGGRRKYNAERQRQAAARRLIVEARYLQVVEKFLQTRQTPRGWQTRLAKELGISRMQIGCDLKRLHLSDETLRHIAYMIRALQITERPIRRLEKRFNQWN